MTATRWGDAEFTHQLARVQWMASPMVQLHLNERSTGSAARDWLTAWAPRFFPDGDLRVLVLGCGEGWLERALARRPEIVQIDAIDVASDAVSRARDAAAREGLDKITYRVADLNVETLGPESYGVIIAHSVLHHVERLEHAFTEIERALKPGGSFLMNEYVGPHHFQYGDDVHEIINELLRAIPERFRRGTVQPGLYSEKRRATEQEIIAEDPSEAVRSDELLPMMAARFAIIDRIDLGGTVLQHLLYDIVPNFEFDVSLARSVVELLCICDAALVDAVAIPSDYVLVAARKKGAPPLPKRELALPPLSADVRKTIRDPLGWGPKRRLRRPRDPRAPRALEPWILRALRVALLARASKRSILNPDSRVQRTLERLRFALRRDRSQSAFDHLLARLPQGSEIIPLIETVERITIRHAL